MAYKIKMNKIKIHHTHMREKFVRMIFYIRVEPAPKFHELEIPKSSSNLIYFFPFIPCRISRNRRKKLKFIIYS